MRNFTGHSRDESLSAPFLKQSFFKKGTKIEGTVLRRIQNENGIGYVLTLKNAVQVNGKKEKIVVLGDMAGLRMALNSAGVEELHVDDKLIAECIGQTDTGKGNPRTDFKVGVQRPD